MYLSVSVKFLSSAFFLLTSWVSSFLAHWPAQSPRSFMWLRPLLDSLRAAASIAPEINSLGIALKHLQSTYFARFEIATFETNSTKIAWISWSFCLVLLIIPFSWEELSLVEVSLCSLCRSLLPFVGTFRLHASTRINGVCPRFFSQYTSKPVHLTLQPQTVHTLSDVIAFSLLPFNLGIC